MHGNTVKNGIGGVAYWVLQNTLGQLIVADPWVPELQIDEALNDSDKTFTVDADEYWKIQSIWIESITDGTAADREIVIEILDDADDVVARVKAGIVQAQSITRYYLFAPNVTELTTFRGTALADTLSTIIPNWTLLSGWKVHIYDITVTAVAGDDLIIQMMIEKKTIS